MEKKVRKMRTVAQHTNLNTQERDIFYKNHVIILISNTSRGKIGEKG
jgi:hypothetical protein